MKVIAAHPLSGHELDTEVELPEAEARRLLQDGYARLPEQKAKKSRSPKPAATAADTEGA